MDNHKIAGRKTAVGEDGNSILVGLLWRTVGSGDFNRNGGAEPPDIEGLLTPEKDARKGSLPGRVMANTVPRGTP